ncbi:MAG: cytochrome c [Planctomycetota bacterium]
MRLTACLILILAGVAACMGCNGEREFERAELLHAAEALTEPQSAAIDRVLVDLFGTPDEPRLPSTAGLDTLLSLDLLRQCSGEVISHEPGVTQGLYGRHCARCHGVTGDGRGPTALYQAPYPRDFRPGVFKWKSTYRDAQPTLADLRRTLDHGVAGAAMPSFRLLAEREREALAQYVAYLSIRGELERELVWFAAEQLEENELVRPSDAELPLTTIVSAWRGAEDRLVDAAAPIDLRDASVIRAGRELYHTERAGCVKCHGEGGQGLRLPVSVADVDYDVWNAEVRARQRDAARSGSSRLIAAARQAFPARPAWGKPLAEPLRGGDAPTDLFRRLHQGIAGTPMPGLGPTRPGGDRSLGDEELWTLVAYARSLSPDDESGGALADASAEDVAMTEVKR